MLRRAALCLLAIIPTASIRAQVAAPPEPKPMDLQSWPDITVHHPAGAQLRRLFPVTLATANQTGASFKASGLKRADYLTLIAGVVDFFKQHQAAAGAIIDPYAKAERQYATPAFALAAATLVKDAGRHDLLDPATRALSFALQALANHTTADGHADFYIPMVVHARRLLADQVPPATLGTWNQQLRSLVPEKAYRDTGGGGNWNLVNVSGECLRRQDGLVAPDQDAAQAAYLERCLERQTRHFTTFGMYQDPNAPLAYDAFPRLWLEDMLADDAYHGAHHTRLQEFLTLGSLSTLLLLSPSGEWACGGRSAHHQWNEAEVAVISEVNARRWMGMGRPDVAGAFKRAAHLALTSMRRWQRPSGELWIVKNHADPSLRFGYESYSFHSQYNLLAVAMLAMAYQHADDRIQETPTPAERGGYVFDLRDTFHKICASAGGTYVLIDTGADPHYNSTGLLRVHKAGVALSPYSDNPASHRAYGPPGAKTTIGMSPGLQWQSTLGDTWQSLADFPNALYADKAHPMLTRNADLNVMEEMPERVRFAVRYNLEGGAVESVREAYTISAEGVEVTTRLASKTPLADTRALFPVLMSDGATDTAVYFHGAQAETHYAGAVLTWEVVTPQLRYLDFKGPDVVTHNGSMQAAIVTLPVGTQELQWRLQLDNEKP